MILHPKPERPLRHPKPWGVVDLKATLLDWYGLPAGRTGDGESLFPESDRNRTLYSVSLLPTLFFGAEPSLGVRRGENLYLRHAGEELYDLAADPGEQRNLRGKPAGAEATKELRALADRKWPQGWLAAALPSAARPSSEEERRLRSLGYVAGSSPASVRVASAPLDRMMKDFSEWELARETVQASGRNEPLLGLLPRLVGRYPSSFSLRKDYGAVLGMAGRPREAVEQLEAAVRLFDGDAVVLGNLGSMYLSEGRVEEARGALERSVAIEPGRAGSQKNLGIIYAEYLKQPDRAIAHFEKYLEAGGDAEAGRIRTWVENAKRAGGASSPVESRRP